MRAGRLIGMARRSASRAPIEELESGFIGVDCGLEGDHRGRVKPGKLPKRQVTILAREDWDAACADLGKSVPWTARRANLFIEGLRLPRRAGDIVAIGAARLEIMLETDPCQRMDEAEPGLQDALRPDWRGGVCCRVIEGGVIALGDTIRIEEKP